MITCPNCSNQVREDVNFCGACGFNLQNLRQSLHPNPLYGASPAMEPPRSSPTKPAPEQKQRLSIIAAALNWLREKILGRNKPGDPELSAIAQEGSQGRENQDLGMSSKHQERTPAQAFPSLATPGSLEWPPVTLSSELPDSELPPSESPSSELPPVEPSMELEAVDPLPAPSTFLGSPITQLQQQRLTAQLLHVQSGTVMELPQYLSVIHLGKPNDLIPPDLDVSGFENADVVSRVHADIRREGDLHYLEDVGSSNGTYVNNTALVAGYRHRLQPGDRISLGKGDLMTFIFGVDAF